MFATRAVIPLRRAMPVAWVMAVCCLVAMVVAEDSAVGRAVAAANVTEVFSDGTEYDVIIVGGGLVGSAVAGELVRLLPEKKVLLLEAGEASQKVLGGKDVPAAWNRNEKRWDPWPASGELGLTRYDVPGNYMVLQCWDRSCRESWGSKVPYFQCKVLGGCGVVNGALMQIPHADTFEHWPEGWHFENLEKYFNDTEALFRLTSSPSNDGVNYLVKSGGAATVEEALKEQGFTSIHDLKVRANTFTTPVVTVKDGVRQSTASELLPKALQQPNFKMVLGAEVQNIEHRSGEASGVSYVDAAGARHVAGVRDGGLVVLTAGGLNTPRLLLASGLDGQGAVGDGISDHTLQSSVYKMSQGEGSDGTFVKLSPPPYDMIMEYADFRSGPLTQYGPTLTAFFRAPFTSGPPDVYDVEVWVTPMSKRDEVHLSMVLMRPTCPEGRLVLGSDAKANIESDLHAGCEADRNVMSWAWGQVDSMMAKKGGTRVYQSGFVAMNHFAGGCAIGHCASSETLLVKGTQNVAVADAAALPGTIWGHPAMALTAFGLKAANVLANVARR